MRALIQPTASMYETFRDCREDWGAGPGLHEDGFGIDENDDVDSPEGFQRWVRRMLSQVHPVDAPCPDRPHWSPRWIVEDGRILGGIALRHQYNDMLGRVGYGIRPSARGRGVATWALNEILAECRDVLRLDRALLICVADNVPSARTIERCGGVLERIVDNGGVPIRRYWVDLTA
jgi:predicted acetyltransferase